MLFKTDAEVVLEVTRGLDHSGFDTSHGNFTNRMNYTVRKFLDPVEYRVDIHSSSGKHLSADFVRTKYEVIKILLDAATW